MIRIKPKSNKNKELFDELDSWFNKYSDKNPGTMNKALAVIIAARDIMTDSIRTVDEIEFDLLKTSGDYDKIKILQDELSVARFFGWLDTFFSACEPENIPLKDCLDYINKEAL
jgi:sugar-specific transcriptional regulator TrmB